MFFSSKEVLKLLNCTPRRVTILVKKGFIKPVNSKKRKILFSSFEIQDYILKKEFKTKNSLHSRGKVHCKDYNEFTIKLFNVLYLKPVSRRMAATKIGFPDQTYMVTQFIHDWINQGKAQVVGIIKCKRSGRMVEAVTTNPIYFKNMNDIQLTLNL